MSIEHADFAGTERLALVLGGEIVSTFDNPEKVKLATCEVIEEVMIGEDKVIRFSGVPKGEACTIVLRGATDHMLDEAERSLHDALCVLSQTVKGIFFLFFFFFFFFFFLFSFRFFSNSSFVESMVLCGGGSSEMAMSSAVMEVAQKTSTKESVAIEAFAHALNALPTILADNAGLLSFLLFFPFQKKKKKKIISNLFFFPIGFDSAELISQLRAKHSEGTHNFGLDLTAGAIRDMTEIGVTDSYKLKRQIVMSAGEAAEMILRVDRIVKAAPRQRVRDEYPC